MKNKIAIVHDFLTQSGGAERVLKVLSDMYPEAPIYTLLYDEGKMGGMFKGREIRASYLQKFPNFLKKHHRWLIPFFPVVVETFDLREFDLVISSSGAWSKGIVTKLNTKHVAYLHSPMRFAWDYSDQYIKEIKERRMSFMVRFLLSYLRVWDKLAAERPDYLISNSKYTQERVNKYYRRESKIIYPPVNNGNQQLVTSNQKVEKVTSYKLPVTDYFLVVSRLSPYKKVDLVVEAFNKLGLPLVIIGQGEQENYLRKIANDNIEILGWQSDDVVQDYMKNATAFIFPCVDDFGMAPVEAMCLGVPVIAYRKGGALETIEEGITGEFFNAQTMEVLADGIRRFVLNKDKYDKNIITKKAQEFSRERFEREMRALIFEVTENEK
ncbi:MAG: hypothetical protein ACD_5C00139G0005 [uncultured bacterium]|nr:MAG: hypothetical protein ACD_5C00139G0005 [uncultured bacterium]